MVMVFVVSNGLWVASGIAAPGGFAASGAFVPPEGALVCGRSSARSETTVATSKIIKLFFIIFLCGRNLTAGNGDNRVILPYCILFLRSRSSGPLQCHDYC